MSAFISSFSSSTQSWSWLMMPSSSVSTLLKNVATLLIFQQCLRRVCSSARCSRQAGGTCPSWTLSFLARLIIISMISRLQPQMRRISSHSWSETREASSPLNLRVACLIVNLVFLRDYMNYSSSSFLRIFPNAATSASSCPYFFIPLTMLIAHSTVIGFSPYFWLRYVYMCASRVSMGMLDYWQIRLCFALDAYISLISSLSWLRERALLNLMLTSSSCPSLPSLPLPFPADLDCFLFMMLFMVVSRTLLLLVFVILSSSSAFLAQSVLISFKWFSCTALSRFISFLKSSSFLTATCAISARLRSLLVLRMSEKDLNDSAILS